MIFFDVDETLLDFKGAEYTAVQALHREFAHVFPFSSDGFYKIWCTVGKKHYAKFLDGIVTFEQQKVERIREIFGEVGRIITDADAANIFQLYLTRFEESWQLFDDVSGCLEDLAKYDLGIISNGDADQQRRKLEKLGILEYFDVIVTADEAGAAKPDPRIFAFACERAGKPPSSCFYIGDDWVTDIKSCRRANMQGIWLNRGKRSDPVQSGWMIHDLKALKSLIEGRK
ncbi:MAG TPA: HAD family hydrolase [Bacillales bacterium]|nr:HAD family hydrolase [Bacillales bacterium]